MNANELNAIRQESAKTGVSIVDLIRMRQNASMKRIVRNKHEEDNLQFRCVSRFDEYFNKYRLLLNHCPSEGRRSASDGAKFKKMGLRAGYPDLVLHLARHGYGCLGIELKTPQGKQSEHQKVMQAAWKEAGNMYIVIRSLEQFMTLMQWYINGDGELLLPAVTKDAPIRQKSVKILKK